MKIIERFIQSKTRCDEDCEDGIFVSKDYIAVVDGVTSKSKKKLTSETSGKDAVNIICSALAKASRDWDALRCMTALNKAIADWYRGEKLYARMRIRPAERATAAIAVYSNYRRQIWFVADCQALVDGILFTNNKRVDVVMSEARAMFIESALRKGSTVADFQKHDFARAFIFPLLKRQCFFQNARTSEFKFAVLDGFFWDKRAIKVVMVPSGSEEIVLASDGYPKLAASLKQSERILHQILKKDPLLFRRHKSTKGLQNGNVSYDDRAYVRFTP